MTGIVNVNNEYLPPHLIKPGQQMDVFDVVVKKG